MSGRLDPFLFPATALLAGTTDAVVVHSEWARQEVEARLPGLKVCRVGLPAADPGVIDRASIRHGLGLALETLVLMHLGFLTAEKGLLEILEAVAAAARLQVPVHLIAVGEGEGLQPLIDAAASLGIADKVSATGWAPKAEFLRLPAAADLGIVLRTPSAGETSAAAVRFLACGTPVAAIGQRQFLEWPEAAVPRICPGPSSAPDLARLLVSAAEQSTTGQWENRRRAARAAYESQHRPAETAEALVSFFADLPLRT